MSVSRLGAASAAVALSGLALLAVAGPAGAAAGDNCPNPAGKYPPGQCKKGGSISDNTPPPGQPQDYNSNGWKGDSSGKLYAESTPIFLGTFHADSAGVVNMTITIPLALANEVGAHKIVAQGIAPNGAPLTETTPFTITAANAQAALAGIKSSAGGSKSSAGGGQTASGSGSSVGVVQLPRTGAEIATISAIGIALIGAGGIAVYSGRRRRTTAA